MRAEYAGTDLASDALVHAERAGAERAGTEYGGTELADTNP
ncbi:hypothetical protein [Streptomyces hygroscopicus]|nr:hypothetical protein [Streptomyces hygroscopicus]